MTQTRPNESLRLHRESEVVAPAMSLCDPWREAATALEQLNRHLSSIFDVEAEE